MSKNSWPGRRYGATVWAAIFGLAVVSTALAYVLFFRILAGAGAVNITILNAAKGLL